MNNLTKYEKKIVNSILKIIVNIRAAFMIFLIGVMTKWFLGLFGLVSYDQFAHLTSIQIIMIVVVMIFDLFLVKKIIDNIHSFLEKRLFEIEK